MTAATTRPDPETDEKTTITYSFLEITQDSNHFKDISPSY